MTQWPHDDTVSKNAFYGDFLEKGWANHYLIRIMPPFKMYYEKSPMRMGLLVNRQCANAMLAALREIWDKCDHDQAKVDVLGASDFGGCFNIRQIAGNNNWSNHSWACAIDLDPSRNGFNTGHGHMQAIAIDAFKRQGALWGGDYKGRTDPMHFEFVSR